MTLHSSFSIFNHITMPQELMAAPALTTRRLAGALALCLAGCISFGTAQPALAQNNPGFPLPAACEKACADEANALWNGAAGYKPEQFRRCEGDSWNYVVDTALNHPQMLVEYLEKARRDAYLTKGPNERTSETDRLVQLKWKCLWEHAPKPGSQSPGNLQPGSSATKDKSPAATAVEQKRQDGLRRAVELQSRADELARKGIRRTHDRAAEAHHCIDVDTTASFGGFRNKCNFEISYGYCVYHPKKGGWTDSPSFSCAGMTGKETAGGQTVSANGFDANHTKGGEQVYYFACRAPAHALDLTFSEGSGLLGRCRTFGGN
jgi:hypothetical protein